MAYEQFTGGGQSLNLAKNFIQQADLLKCYHFVLHTSYL